MSKISKMILLINLVVIYLSSCQETVRMKNNEIPTFDQEIDEIKSVSNHCTSFNFRYLEIENSILSSNHRKIQVFLDEKEFSIENLKILFSYLSNKNPDPKYVTILVKTNWEQLPLPSDCPGTGASNKPEEQNKNKYRQAVFYRRGENEYFQYYFELKSSEPKFVVLKGKVPK